VEAGAVVDGRFEIEAIAGKGGMGVVYRARDRQTGEPVALKVLDGDNPDRDQRFAREARVLADLDHPAIVGHIADGLTAGEQRYLALEWLEGEPLHQVLRARRLTDEEALALAVRIAGGLEAAHARGIIHRDIKPSNIFLIEGRPDRAVLLDFGVARLTAATHLLTNTGTLIGTPAYMSPEQARRGRELGTATDIFSLGAVLFQCLTGQPPFAGDQVYAILAKIVFERPPRVRELRPDIPAPFDRLVARMTAREPEERPGAAELVRELAELEVDADAPDDDAPSTDTLTDQEQRLMSVVFARAVQDTEISAPDQTAATVTAVARPLARSGIDPQLADAARPYGARLERLLDGSLVALVAGGDAATDLAVRAARCALAMQSLLGGAAMALATGRAVLRGHTPVGEVIDRAAALVGRSGGIPLDEVTAALLPGHFDVGVSDHGVTLRGERERLQPVRTLLGKPTPCVGRERELGFLLGLLDECIEEPMVQAVFVTGPPGIGKSRVRHELLQRIDERGLPVQVLIGRGDPMSAGAPFGLVAQALRRAIGVSDDDAVEIRLSKLTARIGVHVPRADRPRVIEFLGELIGAPAPGPGSVQLRTARRDPVVMGDQIQRAWIDWLRAESQLHPVLLVLEDLHWGDLPTVRLVDRCLRALRGRPFMVLALARPDVHEIFPGLWAERGGQELRLNPLRRTAGRKLVRAALGDQIAEGTLERIVDHAGGNAFFLEELIRAVDEGALGALPDTVLAMVQVRLQDLPGDARRVLRAASVFGQVFWDGGLLALLGTAVPEDSAAEWLAVLEHRELVGRRADSRFRGQHEYVFRHAFVCEAAYAMLTEEDRRRGHRLAGLWLDQVGEADAGTLGAHFEQGGDRASAAACYRRAAEQALEGNDFEATVARARRGIDCGASGELLGELELLCAEALRWSAANTEAAACAYRAMQILPRGSAHWCQAARMVGLYDRDRDGEIVRALCSLEPGLRGDGWIIAVASVAARLFLVGRPELGNRLRDELGDPEALRDPEHPELCAWLDRLEGLWTTGSRGRALRKMISAAESFERAGDIRNATMHWMNVGFNYCELGAYDDGERVLRDCLERSRQLGSASLISAVLQNLGFALIGKGGSTDLREGIDLLQSSVEALGNDYRLLSGAHGYLALAYLRSGDLDAAEASARAAAEVAPPGAGVDADADATLAEVLLRRGRPGEALERATAAIRKVEEASGDADELYVRAIHAQALHAAGHHDQARRAVAVARERLLASVATIGDPELEQSCRDKVWHHRRILECARSWLG
jgi:eukaryotic-like serine/threonine-protein kinase